MNISIVDVTPSVVTSHDETNHLGSEWYHLGLTLNARIKWPYTISDDGKRTLGLSISYSVNSLHIAIREKIPHADVFYEEPPLF